MNREEKIIKRMSRLVRKEIFDELTSEERVELEDWLNTDPANRAWRERMGTFEFVRQNGRYATEITDAGRAWKRLEGDMKRGDRRYIRVWICSAAAMIVVAFCIMFFWQKGILVEQMPPLADVHESALVSLLVDRGKDSIQLEVNEDIQLFKRGLSVKDNALVYDTLSLDTGVVEYHTLSVGRGGEYRLTLADGTIVWLNSESVLRYPARFTGNRREVELRGEAFFDVRRDENRPFTVRGGDFNVKVLGTSFNIMNYSDEPVSRVTLASGKLQVNKGERQVIIHPNEQVLLEHDRLDVREVDARYYTSWIENKFMFDDESLDMIMRKLARWYNLEYEFKDTTLEKTRFSGQLFKYKEITKAFELLEKTTNVHFVMNQKTIQIMRKEI